MECHRHQAVQVANQTTARPQGDVSRRARDGHLPVEAGTAQAAAIYGDAASGSRDLPERPEAAGVFSVTSDEGTAVNCRPAGRPRSPQYRFRHSPSSEAASRR